MDVTGLITVLGGAKLIEKLLGPSCEYIGENLESYTKKMASNLSKIFSSAEKKLGNRIEEPGKISPKVLKSILENGAWCEEELQAEYFGGVLASSRVDVSRDDRGAYFSSIICDLSSYQLRLHYLFYSSLRELFIGQPYNIGDSSDRRKVRVFIPDFSFIVSMEFTPEEMKKYDVLKQHAIWGLVNAGLIDRDFMYGSSDYLQKQYPEIKESGMILRPSQLGSELFLWAYGHGQHLVNSLLDKNISFSPISEIKKTPVYSF